MLLLPKKPLLSGLALPLLFCVSFATISGGVDADDDTPACLPKNPRRKG